MKQFLPRRFALLRAGAIVALVVCLFAARSEARTATSAAPDFAAIDAFVESERQAMGIPGLALGIVQGDRIVHLQGFGIADPSGRVVTPETPFDIASLNKSMIALAVMQLVEAGKVELDAPVQRYLPWFQVADEADSARITMRHLLNQTSGLPAAQNFADAGSVKVSDNPRERRVRALRTVTLAHPPGTTYAYVSDNFVTLALVVEMISGQSYGTYLQEHVFGPLTMRQTFISQNEARPHGLATGYQSWFVGATPAIKALPAGLASPTVIFSSAEDMARYLLLYLNQGRLGEAQLLSADSVTAMLQPAIAVSADAFYGMGWDVGQINGIPTVAHTGTGSDFWSRMILHPAKGEEQGWGIVALFNQRALQQTPRMSGMVDSVAALVQGDPLPARSANPLLLAYRGLLALAVLQLIGIGWSALVLQRWWQHPARRPRREWRSLFWRVALPAGLHALVALVFLVALPQLYGGSAAFIVAVDPDLGYVALVSGWLALGWGTARTVLSLLLLREQSVRLRVGLPLGL